MKAYAVNQLRESTDTVTNMTMHDRAGVLIWRSLGLMWCLTFVWRQACI